MSVTFVKRQATEVVEYATVFGQCVERLEGSCGRTDVCDVVGAAIASYCALVNGTGRSVDGRQRVGGFARTVVGERMEAFGIGIVQDGTEVDDSSAERVVSGGSSGTTGDKVRTADGLQPDVSPGGDSGEGAKVFDGSATAGSKDSADSDGLSGVSAVSSRTLLNRGRRQKAKLRKQRKQAEAGKESVPEWRRKDKDIAVTPAGGKVVDVTPARYVAGLINADSDAELKDSVKAKWIAKNRLEAAKAEREFAVLQGVDVDVAVRKQNVIMRSAIERGLVTIEKSHASLRGADVHSSEDESRIHTMLSGSSGSISPNSSVSEAELRAMIARDAELERKNAELEKRVNDLIAQMTKGGVKVTEEVPAPKSMWTVDEHGELLQEHQNAFFDNDYSWTTGDAVPRRCADGKMRTYVNYY